MTKATATASPIELIEPVVAETKPLALVDQPTHAVAPSAVSTRDDILLAAMNRGFKPDEIAQMMDLRDRQDRYVGEKAFREDFAAFRGENIIVPRSKYVDRGKAGSFMQAEYHVAAELLSPALSRHGFSFRHDMKFGSKRWMTDGVENDIAWVHVTCYLEHRAGHSERLDLEGPPGDLSANTAVQNMQVTGSFLKRQSLLAITGTATGGEDDENAMRGQRSGNGGNHSAAAPDPENDTALQAGRDAALEGTAALTAWWGRLGNKDRTRLNKDFGRLKRDAAQVDQGARSHG